MVKVTVKVDPLVTKELAHLSVRCIMVWTKGLKIPERHAVHLEPAAYPPHGVLQFLKAKGATVMSKNGAQVLERALALPPDERAEMADRLLSSLDTKRQRRIDEMWAEEAEDRIDALERGEIRAVSVKQAFEANKGAMG